MNSARITSAERTRTSASRTDPDWLRAANVPGSVGELAQAGGCKHDRQEQTCEKKGHLMNFGGSVDFRQADGVDPRSPENVAADIGRANGRDASADDSDSE